MRALKWIALFILAAAAIIIAAACLFGPRAPAMPIDGPDFVFAKGRLWAKIGGDNRTLALIDSGTSMSVFPRSWSFSGIAESEEMISTPFGRGRLPVRRIEPLKIGDVSFEGMVLAGSVSYPLIGNDFIFSRQNVFFTREGLDFDVDYDPEDAIACVRIIVGHDVNAAGPSISSVHFIMNIDGNEQMVYFDTGRRPALEASASAPESATKLFPRVDIRYNMLGQWSLAPYFSRQASISIGDQSRLLNYRQYFTDRSIGAPFAMGAGILNDYSILIDHRRGRACFFQPT